MSLAPLIRAAALRRATADAGAHLAIAVRDGEAARDAIGALTDAALAESRDGADFRRALAAGLGVGMRAWRALDAADEVAVIRPGMRAVASREE